MRVTNRIIVKLYSPDNKKLLRKLIIKAPEGSTFTPYGVEVQISHLRTRLDENIPGHRYKCFPRSKEEFRFYWDSKHKLNNEELALFYSAYNSLDTTPANATEDSTTNEPTNEPAGPEPI